MKQDIRISLKYKHDKIVSLYNVSSNKKENIVNRNMKKILDNDIFASDDEDEENNVPNYDLFNKYVFDIYQQVEAIAFAYLIVVSKQVTLAHQYPTIDQFLKWRKKWFKNDYLEKTIEDINEGNICNNNKKRRRNLNDDNLSFHHSKK